MFWKLPNGVVTTKADDIKFIESPIFKFKLKASSVPINTLFEPKFFKFPFDKYFLKNSAIFFSFLSTPFKITPFVLSLFITIPSPVKDLFKLFL